MDNQAKKQFNKKRFVLVIITMLMFMVVIVILQKGWIKAGIFTTSNNVGDVYLLDDTLYYGSEWYGICTYNEKTDKDSILIKNANSSFVMDDEYIYYRKNGKDYTYNMHTGKRKKSEARKESFYYTQQSSNIDQSEKSEKRNKKARYTDRKVTSEVYEILINNKSTSGDISYAILSEKYFYAKHNQGGGYMGAYNVEGGKQVVITVDGECDKILKYSYSPVSRFMTDLGVGIPFAIIGVVFVLSLSPFLIIVIIFIKKWKDFKNN